MRILITNDDGIRAPQFLALVRWAKKLGEVTVAAPKIEQSGKSQGIELHEPFEVKPFDLEPGVTAYAVDSTPADCIRYMVLGRKEKFDLVISGINRGFNIGADQIYSGTVGAACEAIALGVPAIALSTSPEYYNEAHEQLEKVWRFVCDHRLLEIHPLYNINIPREGKGFRFTHQGGPYYSDDFPHVGNDQYRPTGVLVYENRNDLTLDTDCAIAGYISVMPMTYDKTNWEVYRKLQELNV